MLSHLSKAYNYPVDIEFIVNFPEENNYKINLVQCRPLQVQHQVNIALPTVDITERNRIIESRSAVIGQSRLIDVHKFIYVVPDRYGTLSIQDRHAVARLVGEINRELPAAEDETIMLLGPGRWGTSSPSLGIPVNFSDINRVTVLCEIVAMHKNLIPDVSLGTHFLNELVEMEMLYLALFPNHETDTINTSLFEGSRNRLPDILPNETKWNDTVLVVYSEDLTREKHKISLIADALEQRVICYFEDI
jgi:hypothetical protein